MPPLLSIYCDGAAHDRRGLPGGWAFAVVSDGRALLTQAGAQGRTTNNAMELTAAFSGLRAVLDRRWHLDRTIELVSDSRVALDVASGRWFPKKHDFLAAQLRAACLEAGASTRWVKGHSGEEWNERVDALAGAARQALVPERVKKKATRRAQLRLATR